MAADTFYFYVLLCQDNSYYGGYTTDLVRRLAEHNSGHGAKYTRPSMRRPVKIVHSENFTTKSAAMQAEYAFKKLSRSKKEHYLKAHKNNF